MEASLATTSTFQTLMTSLPEVGLAALEVLFVRPAMQTYYSKTGGLGEGPAKGRAW